MLIQEAIRSGKPFKTPKMHDYLYVKKEESTKIDFFYWTKDSSRCGLFPVDAILSDEWFLIICWY